MRYDILDCHPRSIPLRQVILGIIGLIVLFGFVGQQDYEDARADECWAAGRQAYDAKADACYTPTNSGVR